MGMYSNEFTITKFDGDKILIAREGQKGFVVTIGEVKNEIVRKAFEDMQ